MTLLECSTIKLSHDLQLSGSVDARMFATITSSRGRVVANSLGFTGKNEIGKIFKYEIFLVSKY